MTKEKHEQEQDTETKVIMYRGKTLDFLKGLDVRESAKFLPSRSRRSVLRNFDKVENFIKSCDEKISRKKKIRTHLRDMVVVPKMIGLTIGIHNGQNFQDITLTHEMIGHRLGEFAPTRSKVTHSSAGLGATKSSRAQKK